MTKYIAISCDNYDCKKTITSTLHGGTWLTVKTGDVWTDNLSFPSSSSSFIRYFCGYQCLVEWSIKRRADFMMDPSS